MVINHLARKIGLTKKLEDTFGGKNAGMKNETAGNGFTFPMIPRTKTVKREISAWWNSVPQKWIRLSEHWICTGQGILQQGKPAIHGQQRVWVHHHGKGMQGIHQPADKRAERNLRE